MTSQQSFKHLLAYALAGCVLGFIILTARNGNALLSPKKLIQVHHLPDTVSRRSADLTANCCGELAPDARKAVYSLNGRDWCPVGRGGHRVPSPLFIVEMPDNVLLPGMNTLRIKARGLLRKEQDTTLTFAYDTSKVVLPMRATWSTKGKGEHLDALDGRWETIFVDGEWRVRPTPGYEDYDRLLAITGTFAGGRRVRTSVTFRKKANHEKPFGFGILPLWGGRPDSANVSPQRGWVFSIGWYYSHFNAVGMEFSYKFGTENPDWIATYKGNANLAPGNRYFLVTESWPEITPKGTHLRYIQRMKWWLDSDPEPSEWMTLADTEGCPIPEREYGVALNAHRSQVEFGPVDVEPIASVIVENSGE